MDTTEANERRAQAARKRQAYWRRRREMERLRANQNPLTVAGQLTMEELWTELYRELLFLDEELSGGSSTRLYSATRRAVEYVEELAVRGEQLSLF